MESEWLAKVTSDNGPLSMEEAYEGECKIIQQLIIKICLILCYCSKLNKLFFLFTRNL